MTHFPMIRMTYTDPIRLYHDPATAMRFFSRIDVTRYLLVGSFSVLLIGSLVLGTWFNVMTGNRVIQHEGELYALYVDSVLSDPAQALAAGGLLSDADMLALDKLLHPTSLGARTLGFKLWSRDGRVL